jgi:site-specific DNA recombinase
MTPTARRRRNAAARATATIDRCVCYVRVSTDEQRQSGLGLEAQRQRLQQFAEARGWSIIAEHADEGVSGTKRIAGRPGLQRAIAALEPGVVLLALCLDRLSRAGAPGMWEITQAVEARGAAWATVHGSYDTSTPGGRIVVNILAEFALLEAEEAGERTSRALQAKQARGEYVGAVPFGYTYEPSTEVGPDGRRLPGAWSTDPEQLDTIRTARRLRAIGYTYQQIADELNALGRPTISTAPSWHRYAVATIVKPRDLERRAEDLTIPVDVPADLRDAVVPAVRSSRHACAQCGGVMYGATQKRYCSSTCARRAKYLRTQA